MQDCYLIHTHAYEVSPLSGPEATHTVNKPILGVTELGLVPDYAVFDSGLFYHSAYVIFH